MQPLSISMSMPNRELDKSPMERAITALALSLATQREMTKELQSGPALDITFMLASNGDKPDFDGMRMGGYTSGDNTLYFQAAVPEDYNHSERAKEYVAAVLEDVVTNAIDFFQTTDVRFDAINWKRVVDPILTKADNIHLPQEDLQMPQ